MDAIVLVGGQGTRLRPLTYARHKSLVPVLNRPAIEYLFAWLRRSQFRRAVLAIGQDNDDLARAYPSGDYDGLRIELVQETSRLESGGAIRNAVQTAGISGRFTVLNGDVFVDFDYADALAAHERLQADLTLALFPVSDPSSFGVAAVDSESLVTGFVEKPPPGTEPSNLINAGVWIFEPGLVGEIPNGPVRVEETLFPSLVARRRRVLGYEFSGIWADIGTPARYLALNQALLSGGANAIHEAASVDPTASVESSSVGKRSTLLPGCRVEGSILWEGVDIGSDAVVARIVLPAPGSAVAVSQNGRRGYVASGTTIIVLDVNERTELARGAYG
ncbi:MAG: NDP-sugar synthase, partial [Tepidiformaceae bacterium]